jgi:hypothetical protein
MSTCQTAETSYESKVTTQIQVRSNRTISNNKSDNIIRNNEEGTYLLIGVSISADGNVIKREAKNILKYKDLTTEIQNTWNLKTKRYQV